MTAPTYPDIAAFLVANLDREQAIAFRAMDSDDEPRWAIREQPVHQTDFTISPEVVCSGHDGGGITTWEQATHIVEHQPRKVLDDITAKRQIIKACVLFRDSRAREGNPVIDTLVAIWEKKILYPLAAPFADQPGYQQEWAVG